MELSETEMFYHRFAGERSAMSYVRIAILLCLVIGGVAASAGQQTSTKRGQMLVSRNTNLYVMDDNGSNRRQIAEGVRTAALSPDGDLVAFADSRAIKVVSLGGGGTTTLVRIQEGLVKSLVWAPSQRVVAYEVMLPGGRDALYVTTYPSINEPPQKKGSNYRGMSFSPDGTFLVYADAVATAKKAVGVLYRLNLASGTRDVLYETRTLIEEPKYSPDGTHIAFLVVDEEPDEGDDGPNCAPPPNSLWVLTVGAKPAVKMKPTGPTTVGDFSWSPDGRLLAIDSGGHRV